MTLGELRALAEAGEQGEKETMTVRNWIIYDARGHFDSDNAAVLLSCDSLKEVYEAKQILPSDSAVYSYMLNPKDGVYDEDEYLGMLGEIGGPTARKEK